jgi:hypothetical protein
MQDNVDSATTVAIATLNAEQQRTIVAMQQLRGGMGEGMRGRMMTRPGMRGGMMGRAMRGGMMGRGMRGGMMGGGMMGPAQAPAAPQPAQRPPL